MLKEQVFPGDKLAVIEEYNEGPGTYVLGGELRSSELGRLDVNDARRALLVKKYTPEVLVPEVGMEVVAEVGSVARKDARIDIFMLGGKLVHPTYSGVIHISNVSRDYIRNIDNALRSGDIVKGVLVNVVNRLNQTSIEGPQYGVIYAYCSRCGELLELKQGRLVCPECGRVERRKVASSYGREMLV